MVKKNKGILFEGILNGNVGIGIRHQVGILYEQCVKMPYFSLFTGNFGSMNHHKPNLFGCLGCNLV